MNVDNQKQLPVHLPQITARDREVTLKNLADNKASLVNSFPDYFEAADQLFVGLGCALFNIDAALYVFNQAGDKSLLEELQSKNICFATNFAAERLGTNAVALAQHRRENTVLLGEEHYCSAFAGYICSAQAPLSDIRACLQLVIIPQEKFNEKTLAIIDYFYKSCSMIWGSQITGKVQRVLPKEASHTVTNLVGEAANFRHLKDLILAASRGPGTVLIVGESGTGKELAAHAIHDAGSRRNQPFVSLNCAAIPRELIGSELFGYVDGAFTGARKGGAPGKFELADKGTLFLDEIGDMPLDMQAVLLRVLEDHTVTRLGGSSPKKVDVRIITATNRDLLANTQEKHFRLDLYYRLNVIRLEMIPLREHLIDLPLLVQVFLRELTEIYRREPLSIAPEVMELLCRHSWPGNVRELRNLLERLVNSATAPLVTLDDLPQDFLAQPAAPMVTTASLQAAIHDFSAFSFAEIEREKIMRALLHNCGNKSAVARELRMSRRTLYARLRKYGLC
jgi:transcriptional regulator with PAS, ATPase and Fis domain